MSETNIEGSKESAPPEGAAVSAGRGIAYITLAKLWFMVGGYVLLFALPHLLDQALVGQWNVILSWVSVLNNVMVTATIQSVSKFGSTGRPAQRAALKMQAVLGGGLTLAFLLGAPAIADFQHNPALTAGLRIVSAVVLCYSFYAVFVGTANGARQFQKQAGLDATYTALRASLVVGGAIALHSVLGAVTGFAVAAALILVASIVVVGVGPKEPAGRVGELLAFMLPIAAYLLILNILMFVDLWVLTRLVAEEAARRGVANPAGYASEQAAVYANGVQAFARMPYQLILSVTFVLFPLVSRSTFGADRDATRGYVEKSLRWSLLALVAMAVGTAARPEALLTLVGKKYLAGAPALAPLAFGYVAFSLFSIAGTIINGSGRTLPTTVIGALTLAADAALNFASVSWANAHGRDPLVYAAIATATAMALGLALSLGYLQRTFGASLAPATVARTAVAAALAIAAGRMIPLHGILGLGACAAAAGLFVGALFVLGELRVGELRALRSSRTTPPRR